GCTGSVRPCAARTLMKQSAPVLLLMPVCALSFGVAAAADAPAAPDETQGVALVAHLLPEEVPTTRLARAGLGSLYWAARHPAQAWRVLLPVRWDSIAYADIGVRCAVVTKAPSGQDPCL